MASSLKHLLEKPVRLRFVCTVLNVVTAATPSVKESNFVVVNKTFP